jgi:hypothetical protein
MLRNTSAFWYVFKFFFSAPVYLLQAYIIYQSFSQQNKEARSLCQKPSNTTKTQLQEPALNGPNVDPPSEVCRTAMLVLLVAESYTITKMDYCSYRVE